MKQLPLSIDFEFEIRVTKKNNKGVTAPAEGLIGWQVHISTTKGGTSVDATLTQILIERPEAGGLYSAVFETDDLITYLASFNQVWFVITKPGDVTSYSLPYIVVPLAHGN